MKINSNPSIFIQNQLSRTSAALSRSLQRLSSGKRVNSAADDQSAYSMGVTLDSQIRGLTQANLNINSTSSLLDTASSGISTQIDIIQKMRELAVEASNGTLATSDRANINTEIQALYGQFQQITSNTQFNGINLLDGSFATQNIQLGANQNNNASFTIPSLQASAVFQKTLNTGTFQAAKTSFVVTNVATYTTSADLNGDGKLDLITLGTGASVLLGNGDGTFKSPTAYSTGSQSQLGQIVAGDINGDGITDLVSSDPNDGTVSILIGNGDGSFKSRITAGVGVSPRSLALSDLNGDGKLDVVTADYTDGTISVLMNNGNGTFSPRVTYTVGTNPTSIAIGNLDGHIDIVTSDLTGGNATDSILVGNGDGTFKARSTISISYASNSVRLADLNRDGNLDIINSSSLATANSVSVYLGNGNASFKGGTFYTVGTNSQDVQAADLNGDGILDLVSSDGGSNTLSVLIGNGDGSFQSRSTLASANTGQGLTIADFNKDGGVDILVGNSTGGAISLYFGNTKSVSAVSNVYIRSQSDAQNLLPILDSALTSLTQEQAQLGALHNRLDTVASFNLLLTDNFTNAKSQATDADIAQETASLVRNQILQQAQIAALSQNGLNQQSVLKLLQNF